MSTKARRGILDVFRRSRDPNASGPVETRPAYQFEMAMIENLSNKSEYSVRLKAVLEIHEDLKEYRFTTEQLSKLYSLTKDLLSPAHNLDDRETVIDCYSTMATTQFDQLGLVRAYLFELVEWKVRNKSHLPKPSVKEIGGRLKLLQALTKEGKCISLFEREAPKFIAKWFREISQTTYVSSYLKLVINLVKYNSAFLDRDNIHKFIEDTCHLCYITNSESHIRLSLELLDCLVSYSLLRTEVLDYMVPTVCQTVLVEKLLKPSKQLMTKLLGTHLGRAAIAKMCEIIETPERFGEVNLMRGAIVFLGFAMNPAQLEKLTSGHTAILVSMKKVLSSNKAVVSAEVCRTLQTLLNGVATSDQAESPEFYLDWMLIFDIVEELLITLPKLESNAKDSVRDREICVGLLSELFLTLEKLADGGIIIGADRERLYDIVERSPYHQRSEHSLLRLLEHRARIVRSHPADWLTRLKHLLSTYYIDAPQTLRLRVLEILQEIITLFVIIHDEELCEQIITPYLGKVATEKDTIVGIAALRTIATVSLKCAGSAKRAKESSFDIINSVLTQPNGPLTETAVECLIDIFHYELFACCPHPIQKILDELTAWIAQQYSTSNDGKSNSEDYPTTKARLSVIELFLSFRINSRNQLCIESPADGITSSKHSPFVFSASPAVSYADRLNSQGVEIVIVNIANILTPIALFLQHETNWRSFMSMMDRVAKFLQDRHLMLLGGPPIITRYCTILCSLVSDAHRAKELFASEPPIDSDTSGHNLQIQRVSAPTFSDLQQRVFPILVIFPIHKHELQASMQRALVNTLVQGMSTKSAPQCIRCLTLMLLQLPDQMFKMSEMVLTKLAQISDTKAVALSVLDFLSCLITVPEIFASFTKDNYNKVFAIALPYTKSAKFSRYTVALAHHVIALWFLKCKPEFRPEFASFIMKRLRTYSSPNPNNRASVGPAISASETGSQSSNQNSNEPVSRSRSGSWNERKGPSTHRDSGLSGTATPPYASVNASLQDELVEAADDFLNQYSQGACSLQPRKSAAERFILSGGQHLTWVTGNKVLTITTSGCSTNIAGNSGGVCEKCVKACRHVGESIPHAPSACDDKKPKNIQLDIGPRSMSVASRDDVGLNRKQETVKCSSDEHIYHHTIPLPPQQPHAHSAQAISGGSAESVLGSTSSAASSESGSIMHRVCNCWCRNWAEVTVRRPSGVTSVTLRLQNDLYSTMPLHDVVVPDITSLFSNLTTMVTDATDTDSAFGADPSRFVQKSAPSSPTEPTPKLIQRSVSMTEKERTSKRSPRADKIAAIPEEPKSKRPLVTFNEPPGDTAPIFPTSTAESPGFRDRARTISVMTPTRQNNELSLWKDDVVHSDRACLSPQFIFKRLFAEEPTRTSDGATFRPMTQLLPIPPNDGTFSNSIEVLDRTLAYETHKIGIIYVDADQENNETAILANAFGSRRYMKFLQGLGSYVCLKDIHGASVYNGGLDTRYGEDGNFSIAWHDDVMQVMFHVATMMPFNKNDPVHKKLHIGNDFVVIVYNNSGKEYIPPRSQFLHACVIVTPQSLNTSLVKVWLRKELQAEVGADEELTHGIAIHDDALPKYARQLALHMNIASTIHRSNDTYVNNWLERLRIIKRLRAKLLSRLANDQSSQQQQQQQTQQPMSHHAQQPQL